MDLIYTDTNRKDVGVLKDYNFDLAFGSDENDFELTIDLNNHCCQAGCLVYIEATEYGGIIDGINIHTSDSNLSYKGRTWHGILASKVIEPDAGNPYLTVSGEANEILGNLIKRLGLSDLFAVSEDYSGINIESYSFDRYIDGYSGIVKMLTSVSGKLKFEFITDKVIISALPSVDYSQDEQFDNDTVEMEMEKVYNPVNHLICLGKGELSERQVLHLYLDASGNISETQTFTGLQEVAAIYDYPNAESSDELKKSGTEKLQEYASGNKVQLNFVAEETIYDIGDVVGTKDVITGTLAVEKITKKIVTITQGLVNIQYKVGE